MVHLNGLYFGGQLSRSKSDDHAGFDDTSLNTANRHCANTADLVDVLQRKAKGLVSRARRRDNSVQSFQESFTLDNKIMISKANKK